MSRPTMRIALAATVLAAPGGCSSLVGGPVETPTIYAPEPAATADPGWPTVSWSLGTVRPTAPKILDGSRIAVSPVPGELQVYRGAMWARPPAELLEDTVLRTLEGHKNWVTGLAFPKSRMAASVADDLSVRLWDPAGGKEIEHIDIGKLGEVGRCLAFSPDGATLAVGTAGWVIFRYGLK